MAGKQVPRQSRAQLIQPVEKARIDDVLGKRLQLAGEKRLIPAEVRMFDSLQQIARFGEIAAGPPVQFGRTGRIAIRQPAKHRFTKQAMIAIMTVLPRSEEHTSELQSLMRISYDV